MHLEEIYTLELTSSIKGKQLHTIVYFVFGEFLNSNFRNERVKRFQGD